MANDAFKLHKRFHLLEKRQFSQEKVQMCENLQICRADFGKKSTVFRGAPCAKTCMRGYPPSRQGSKWCSPALIVALVWLLLWHMLHQFVSLVGSQRPCTVVSQLCTLCEHAVLANLVTPIKLGDSGRLRGRCPKWAWFREMKGGSPGGADHGLE